MKKSQTLITFLPLLLLASTTATAGSRPTALTRRGLTTNCNSLFGTCTDQWPFSPITSGNHFISRPFLRRATTPPSVVVPSPPPPVFTNPSFTAPSDDTNPSFSPLVASPPPPGNTIPPVLPELPPADGGINAGPPFFAYSFSPPANVNLLPVNPLPPIAGKNQPDVFMSPPQPLVPIDTDQMPEYGGELPQQQVEDVAMLPPVAGDAGLKAQVPPEAQSPPAA